MKCFTVSNVMVTFTMQTFYVFVLAIYSTCINLRAGGCTWYLSAVGPEGANKQTIFLNSLNKFEKSLTVGNGCIVTAWRDHSYCLFIGILETIYSKSAGFDKCCSHLADVRNAKIFRTSVENPITCSNLFSLIDGNF